MTFCDRPMEIEGKTEMIMSPRRGGKSRELIEKSAQTGTYILVANSPRAHYLFEMARDLGFAIPFPVTVQEFFSSNRFDGSSIRKKGIYIDDVEDVMAAFLSPINVKAVTFTISEQMAERLQRGEDNAI